MLNNRSGFLVNILETFLPVSVPTEIQETNKNLGGKITINVIKNNKEPIRKLNKEAKQTLAASTQSVPNIG